MQLKQNIDNTAPCILSLEDVAAFTDYSFMDNLNRDPDSRNDGVDHNPRQVFSGHYVPVKPTPINEPEYIAHSKDFFQELGFDDSLAESVDFMSMFSGDLSKVPAPMRNYGWATGYALSIYGTEYTQQCPFKTGNGYGDGRAISVMEAVINNQRWEMQLKGGGPTPYCRGADGRAVLRSSVREFLAQEHMHSLGVPTSRSLSLYVSKTDKVKRPWYSEGSRSEDPDMLAEEAVAISTRVAPSFLRVGQIELFGRRARNNAHANASKELEQIVYHLIDREYANVIDADNSSSEKIILLAKRYRDRLAALVANWMRVGYCQGNFNSDNCAAGGFTLDYGPFGFCEKFDPYFQPWTGGGEHFAFWNQPAAAELNFQMFCHSLKPLLTSDQDAADQLEEIEKSFANTMQDEMEKMWAAKLGLDKFNAPLFNELLMLMMQTPVDYTIFFRELSSLPDDIEALKKSFYNRENTEINKRWSQWLKQWHSFISARIKANSSLSVEHIAKKMKSVNPKYILREWHLAPAYQQANVGDYAGVRELQAVMTQPFAEQSKKIEDKYYRLKPIEFIDLAGVSYMSCSS